MVCANCLRYFGVIVVVLAVLLGLGVQGYYDLGAVFAPVVRVLFSWGLLDHVMLKEVSDGVNPPFRSVGVTQAHFDKVRLWRPLQDDVIIATFPKSGSHLMAQLVSQTLNNGELEVESLVYIVVAMDFATYNPEYCNDSHVMTTDNYKTLAPTRRGVISTHFPSQAVYFPGHKHIVVCRHPEDILLSFSNMLESILGAAAPDIYSAFRMFGKFVLGWATYYSQWWDLSQKHPTDVLFLFYEDVIADLPATIQRIAHFVNHVIPTDAVEKVAYLSSMEYMKKNAQKFDTPPSCRGSSSFKPRAPKMINNGTAGRGRVGLPNDVKHDLRAQILQGLQHSDFPIKRYYD